MHARATRRSNSGTSSVASHRGGAASAEALVVGAGIEGFVVGAGIEARTVGTVAPQLALEPEPVGDERAWTATFAVCRVSDLLAP